MIGVLAIQGAFIEHFNVLHRLGQTCCLVKTSEELSKCDGLIIPGGESTTMALICQQTDLWDKLIEYCQCKPVWGTCAGLILLSKEATHTKQGGQPLLKALNVQVSRNAFGSQINSFSTPLDASQMGYTDSFQGVFIRAPVITKILDSSVKVLIRLSREDASRIIDKSDDVIVAVQQDHLLGTSFHPELTNDDRIHKYFIKMVEPKQ